MGDGAEILGVPEVLAKWGIKRCDQVRDILGFMGDASDNIPGIPGVGPKTAEKLISQYDTLENALDHAEEQKGKLKESLIKFRDQAVLSKKLATIDINVPLPFEPEKLRIGPRDDEALRACFTEFEFNTLGRRLFGDSFKAGRGAAAQGSTVAVTDDREVVPPVDSAAQRAAATSEPLNPSIPPHPVALRTIDDVNPTYQIVTAISAQRTLLTTFADLKSIAWPLTSMPRTPAAASPFPIARTRPTTSLSTKICFRF